MRHIVENVGNDCRMTSEKNRFTETMSFQRIFESHQVSFMTDQPFQTFTRVLSPLFATFLVCQISLVVKIVEKCEVQIHRGCLSENI